MAEIKLSEVELLLTHDVLNWNREAGFVEVRRIDGVHGMYDIVIEDGVEYFTGWSGDDEEQTWM
jgi:hypothetical protein